MQYTASSFAAAARSTSSACSCGPEARAARARRPASRPAPSLHSDTPTTRFAHRVFAPAVPARSRGLAAALRWLQHGRIQLYVLYIAVTLLVLLVWKLG